MFFSFFLSLSLSLSLFLLSCYTFLYSMHYLSLLLCVHDRVLGKVQHTHCLQICTTSWLSFTSWHAMCLILGSAQQETKGNSGHFWVNNIPGAWVAFWFWEIYDCFWMPYYSPDPHPSYITVLHGLVCVSTLSPWHWPHIYLLSLQL